MFDFMRLPQELRDAIYGHALVQDTIRIVVTEKPTIARTKIRVYFWRRKILEGILKRCETDVSYCMDSKNATVPNLNLFLVSRDVYNQAWPIFYKGNQFNFALDDQPFLIEWPVRRCMDFLRDRPQHILAHIRHLRIHIWYNGVDLNQELIPCSHWVFNYWKNLCVLLNTKMNLRTLWLDVSPAAINLPFPYIAWAEHFVPIPNLQRLHVSLHVAYRAQDESRVLLAGPYFVGLLGDKLMPDGASRELKIESLGTEVIPRNDYWSGQYQKVRMTAIREQRNALDTEGTSQSAGEA